MNNLTSDLHNRLIIKPSHLGDQLEKDALIQTSGYLD